VYKTILARTCLLLRLTLLFAVYLLYSINQLSAQIVIDSSFAQRVAYMKKFDGKIIRHISISNEMLPLQVGPKAPKMIKGVVHLAQVTMDAFHRDSKIARLEKYLLIRENGRASTDTLLETERILRSFAFLEDAVLEISKVPGSPDSIDVNVITYDIFSISPKVRFNNFEDFSLGVTEENLLGSTNQLGVAINYDSKARNKIRPGASFTLRNPFGEFTNITAQVNTFGSNRIDGSRNELSYGLAILHPLLSNLFTWDGGLGYSRLLSQDYYNDSLFEEHKKYDAGMWNGWVGFNHQKLRDFKFLGYNRSLFFTAHGFTRQYNLRPANFDPDRWIQFYNYKTLLFQATLYRRSYYRLRYLFDLGRPEDIEIGSSLSIKAGPSVREGMRQTYLGADLHISQMLAEDVMIDVSTSLGGYRQHGEIYDMTGFLSILFVPKKHEYAKFYWRNYISLSYSLLSNLQYHPLINVKTFLSLYNYGNSTFRGDSRAAIIWESQFFFKKAIFGFAIAPLINTQVAYLRNSYTQEDQLHTAFGLGLRFRNPRLAFNAFDIRGFIFPRLIESSNGFGVNVTSRYYFKKSIQLLEQPEILIL